MAEARVTGWEVKEIVLTKYEATTVDVFINTAHVLVDTYLLSTVNDEALLREIELWLAAHLVACADTRVTQKSVGDLSLSYARQSGFGLDATTYGQQVRLLDPTGKLAALQNPDRRSVGFWSNAAGRC